MWTVSRPAFRSLGFCLLAVYFFVSCHMEHVGLLYCSPAIYKTNIFSTVKSINGDFWICLSPPFTSFWLIIKGKMKSILGSTTRWGLAKDSAGQRSSAQTPPQTPPPDPAPVRHWGRAKGEGEGGGLPPSRTAGFCTISASHNSFVYIYFVSMLIPRAFVQSGPFPNSSFWLLCYK